MDYAFVAQERDLPSFEKVINSSEKEEWKKANYEEYYNLNNFSTFTIISTPPSISPIDRKSILYKKHDREENLVYYKVRYVI